MGKPTTGEPEPLGARPVLQTMLTISGMAGRPEKSVTGPVHIAIFRYGYQFQYGVLRIPDRYGFFWPSLLEVQQEQGARFAFVIFTCTMTTVLCPSLALLFMYGSLHDFAVMASLAAGSNCLTLVAVRMISVYDSRRTTDRAGLWYEGAGKVCNGG